MLYLYSSLPLFIHVILYGFHRDFAVSVFFVCSLNFLKLLNGAVLTISVTHLGPAQVPMMSPNGSVPTIYVPPGYAPQVCPFV